MGRLRRLFGRDCAKKMLVMRQGGVLIAAEKGGYSVAVFLLLQVFSYAVRIFHLEISRG